MGTILKYLSKNHLMVNLFILIVLFGGIISYQGLKKDFMPSIDFDMMSISVVYPGASATDVELNAIVPIEEKLEGISGIKEFTSISSDNGGSVFVTIDPDVSNTDQVKDDIFRNISKESIEDLPSEVDKVNLAAVDPDIFPVYEVSIGVKDDANVSDKELFAFVDDLESKLKKVQGVNSISTSGYLDREIHINVDPNSLKKYYISLNDVVNSIQYRNVRSTGGTLQSLQNEQNIVSIGEFENPMDVKDVIVRSNFEQKRVFIKDIASVKDTFEDADVFIRVNKERSVILSISKKSNADIITTTDNIRKFFENNKLMLAGKYEVTVVRDMSKSIRSLLEVVISNAGIGFILVVVILFAFLDLRTSLWTAFGIPLSLLMLFVYMYKMDLTFNTMTLGAIITVLGMLVDHGIVVAEVIHKNRSLGMSPVDSIVEGVKSILAPVIVSVFTTVMAFMPLLAIEGIMGKLIYVFPVVVTATLIFSLVEALFILPIHLGKETTKEATKSAWVVSLEDNFERLLIRVLHHRYIAILFAILIMIPIYFTSKGVISKFVLIWDDSSDKISISLEANKGTSLLYMKEICEKVEDAVYELIPSADRVSMITKVGQHSSGPDSENHTNWGEVVINLIPSTERSTTAAEYIEKLRGKVSAEVIKDLTLVSLSKSGSGPSAGDPVNVKLIGNNVDKVQKYRDEIKKYLNTIHGVHDVDDDQKLGKEELRLVFDYNKLAQHGLSVSDVASTIRTAYEGSVATYIQTLEQKIDFRVKIDDRFQKNKKFLNNLLIPNDTGRLISLSQIASFETKDGKSKINHYNGERVLTITSKIDEKIITSHQVNELIKQKFETQIAQESGIAISFGGEAQRTDETMGGVAAAFLIALLSIYFIIIALFKSFSQPLIIITIIPFALLGALFAFSLHGIPLSLFGLIGMIGLSGVVVNDSVIIVDFINNIKQDGMRSTDNIICEIASGVRERFWAVMLTTLTTIAGLFPTIYGVGGDVGILVPTVMAMGYGLLFATLLTLFITPSLYMVDMDKKKKLGIKG